jgi:hypothetical protein
MIFIKGGSMSTVLEQVQKQIPILANHFLQNEDILALERQAFHTSEPEKILRRTKPSHDELRARAGSPASRENAIRVFVMTFFHLNSANHAQETSMTTA